MSAWTVLALSLCATAVVTWTVASISRERDQARFTNVVQVTRDRIAARLEMYLSLLRAAAALHAASNEVTREDFHFFVARLELAARYPGVQGIGYSKRLAWSDIAAVEARARSEGLADFRVWPEEDREHVTTVLYLEPLDQRNRAALGFDMYTDDARREAMTRAWHSGLPAMSGRVTLKQEIEGRRQAGFLIYYPLYRRGSTPKNDAERAELLDGFIYSPFRADDLFRGIFDYESAPRAAFRVYDGAIAPERLLHDSVTSVGESVGSAALRATVPLAIAGRIWTLEVGATRAFERTGLNPVGPVASCGVLISFVLFWLARRQTEARLRAERSELRGRLLLRLEDELRDLSTPEQMVATSVRMLCEHLAADRCAYGEVAADGETLLVVGEHASNAQTVVGTYKLSSWGEEGPRLLRSNRPLVVADVESDARVAGAERTQYRQLDVRAFLSVPIHKSGRLSAILTVHQAKVRKWTHDDVELASSVANRCWESVERVRTRNELVESEARFRNMADHSPVMMWVIDALGVCTYLNRPWREYTGQTLDEVNLSGWTSAIHPEDLGSTATIFSQAYEQKSPFKMEIRLRRADGVFRWVLAAGAPRFGLQSEFLGFIGSTIDISERKELELERERLLRQAQEAVRVRDDFLSIASHELRTPITALMLQSENVRRLVQQAGPMMDGMEAKLAAMNRQVSRLTSLIEQLLDVSRITSGRLCVTRETVNVAALVRDALAGLGPLLARAGCSLEADVPPFVEGSVDPVRTQQIVDNLVENAAKYGRGRPIHVQVRPDGPHVLISVRDHGIGIAPEHQARIFERFERAVPSEHYGGFGLGLWITRQVTEAMGGSVEVESVLAEGATFMIRLPRGRRLEARPH